MSCPTKLENTKCGNVAVDGVLQSFDSSVLWEARSKNKSWNTRLLSHARGVGRKEGEH